MKMSMVFVQVEGGTVFETTALNVAGLRKMLDLPKHSAIVNGEPVKDTYVFVNAGTDFIAFVGQFRGTRCSDYPKKCTHI